MGDVMAGYLPLYKSHKLVRAAKIAAIEFQSDGSARIAQVGSAKLIPTERGYRERFKGDLHSNDLGYYVVYEDGYESWSPTKAFEEGYTRVEE
jgi:hypothetical protein